MDRTLGVVVPAYEPDVDALESYLGGIATELAPATLRVEIDSASAETVASLERHLAQFDGLDATVSAVDHRRGKGAAITHGFEAMDTDVLAFADADGSVPVDSLADVVDRVRSGRADLAVGSRRHPDAVVRTHQTFVRRRLGDAFASLAGLLLDVELYDYQCGAKAITRDTWRAVRGHLHEPGFAWDVELVAMAGALDVRIEEVPVTWEDHPGSTVDTADTALALLRTLLRVRRRAAGVDNGPTDDQSDAAGSGALVDRGHPEDD